MTDDDPSIDDPPSDTLGMSPEEMRRLGRRVVDIVVERLCNRDAEPAVRTGQLDELIGALGGPLPEEPGSPDEAIDLLIDTVLSNQQHGDHPRYFARVPGPSSFAGILGDWLGIGFNTIATSWVGGSGPIALELTTLRWIRAFIGLPLEGEGILVSGGSMANMTAFAAAFATAGRGIAYLSDQAHTSLLRGLKLLGHAHEDIRLIETDSHLKMPVDVLERAIEEDVRAGKRPAVLVGTAGTTNTGAVDPLDEMADLAKRHGMWLHVDGAYGATGAACPRNRELFKGLDRADSVVIDPHKWLFQPYGLGCTLIRGKGALERAFSMTSEYLRDTVSHSGEPSLGSWGPELTRRSRAIKLWMTFRTYGSGRMRQAIQRGIELAEYAEKVIRRHSPKLNVVTNAQLGIVTFAIAGAGAAEHERLASELTRSGRASVTTTTLKDASVLRLCIINPLTTERDIDETVGFFAAAAAGSK